MNTEATTIVIAAPPISATPTIAPALNKIGELESIRGIAALLVVFYHIPKWNAVLDFGLINNGYLMVELFFVISGFVIFNAYANKIAVKEDLFRFQFLRFGRLYPVHLVFLLAFLGIEMLKYIAAVKLGISSPNSKPFDANNATAFIEHLLLVSAIIPGQPPTFNGPAWSISVEFYTYLVFGLATLYFRKAKLLFFGAVAMLALAALFSGKTYGFDYLLRCFAGFFIGCLTSQWVGKAKLRLPTVAPVIVLAGTLLFLHFKQTTEFDLLIYFLTAALIASLVLSDDGWLKSLLNSRVLLWLGAVSYSLYMSHAAIEWVVNQFIRVALKRPEIVGADGKSLPQLSQPETLLAVAVIAVTVLLVSAVVFNYVEKPMREKSRRLAFTK